MCLWQMELKDRSIALEWLLHLSQHKKCQQPYSPALLHNEACQVCGSSDELRPI